MENWWSLSGIYNYIVEYFWSPETEQSAETTSTPSNDQTNRQTKQTSVATETPNRAETKLQRPIMENWWSLSGIYNYIVEYFWPPETQQSEEAQTLDDTGIADVVSEKGEARSENHQSHQDVYSKENPFVAEISQIPQLCELENVTQLIQESGNRPTHDLSSLTSCFRYIINSQGSNNTSDEREIPNTLCKWAYRILKSGKKGSSWTKVELVDEIGQDGFDYFQQKGILVNTKFHIDGDNSNPMLDGYKMVAQIFCEWFAAHYVKHIAESRPRILDKTLQAIDPGSHQYVYRFACGLSNICTEKILKYLEKDDTWEDFALLCMVEQLERAKDFERSIQKLRSTITEIQDDDSELMERSKLHLVKIASWKKIPIKEILLMGCFSSVDLQLETIVLKSGQVLPKGLWVKELCIQPEDNLTTKHVTEILHFATKCEEMEKLSFDDCNNEIPIDVIDSELLEDIRSKELRIEWFSRNGGGYQLNLKSGIFYELQQED